MAGLSSGEPDRVDRDRVRELVRAELERALGHAAQVGAAAVPGVIGMRASSDAGAGARAAEEIILLDDPSSCDDDVELGGPRSCVIEPLRPCIRSGYCKKLGH